MDVMMDYNQDDVDVLKDQIRKVIEDKPQAYHIMAFIELAVEACYEVTGDSHETMSMLLGALTGAPMLAATLAGDVASTH